MKRFLVLQILMVSITISAVLLFNSCVLLDALLSDTQTSNEKTTGNTNKDFSLTMIEDPLDKKSRKNKEDKVINHKNTKYKDKTIAILAPQFEKAPKNDIWMSQFLQDSLTGQFARLSDMKVLDRKNESVIIAEQKLSESGHYSFDNAAAFGQLTNAEYVLTGTIQKLPTLYSLTFRVNDISTNEIKASFNGQYAPIDIENGKAISEIIQDLFTGLEIPLSETELKSITKNKSETSNIKKLAQGMAAEKNGDLVTALSFLSTPYTSGNIEAATVISEILSVSTPTNIRERANYYKEQIAKWNKIWKDLEKYMNRNYPIIIYDFSKMSDKINSRKNTVDITLKAGIKLVPNRKALVVFNTIWDEWKQIKANKENYEWVRNVSEYHDYEMSFHIQLGLYNKYGELLGNIWYGSWKNIHNLQNMHYKDVRFENQAIPPQFRLFNNAEFYQVIFSDIQIDDKFTEILIPRIIDFQFFENHKRHSNMSGIFSLEEWEAYLEEQE
ncbi:CsgG/HfaB family protein [Treponema denticola]|uniref:CsgG/HfaB family protein n=1 Tax=Treponema denticola TaxID=158 RepID=UPI0020A3B8DF|nr:CsgG/HfaB family protein [Treponema denticola]UTC81874.1 hypothetical protein HGJ18_01140 [Treponema denticola]